MKKRILNRKHLLLILATVLIVFGTQESYGQTLTASTPRPLTESTLHESVVTFTLSGGTYERSKMEIGEAVKVSGVPGVTVGTFGPAWFGVDRLSGTKITVELGFDGNMDADATLTFTVGAAAIVNYNGPALTARVPVSAVFESIVASTPRPLTESTLHESVVTLTLSGGTYERSKMEIGEAVKVSGIPGVTVGTFGPAWFGVDRLSGTKITVELGFDGNMDADAILTFTVGAAAIVNYNGPALITEVPVIAQAATNANNEAEMPDTSKQGPPDASEEDSGQSYIEGPWLWMVVPTDPEIGQGKSTEVDSLADASGGAMTEASVAQNGVSEGDFIGQSRWTSSEIHWSEHQCQKYSVERTPNVFLTILTLGLLDDECIDPTVCWADNISNVMSTLGMGTELRLGARTAYALVNLISPREQRDVILTAKSGDAIKIWLNGNVVYRDAAKSYGRRKIDVPLACDPTVDIPDPALQESNVSRIPVTLKTGNNLLLVKVRQYGEYWGMRVRLGGDFTVAIPQAKTTAVVVASPDLVVEAVQAVPSTVEPGSEFRLYATLRNSGTGESAATTVRYYRSTDDVISTADTQLGRANRNPLAPNATLRRYLLVTAPTTPGTYYYGVCVDSVTDESDTANNCSQAVSVTVTAPPVVSEDVNEDGVVDVQDLVSVAERYGQTGMNNADVNEDGVVNIDDLILVAAVLDADAAMAPSLYPDSLERLSASDIRQWLSEARDRDFTDPSVRRGILFLEQLLASRVPKETVLLANYPNPFNPETWIPYQLAATADVTLTIYDVKGQVVRTLALGHQPAGIYQSRSRAAYWDGCNALGEQVASGVYFSHLEAEGVSLLRKMVTLK